MIPATDQRVMNAQYAYSKMGRGTLPWDDSNIQYWADAANGDASIIWQAAATFINDTRPSGDAAGLTFSQIADNAIGLLHSSAPSDIKPVPDAIMRGLDDYWAAQPVQYRPTAAAMQAASGSAADQTAAPVVFSAQPVQHRPIETQPVSPVISTFTAHPRASGGSTTVNDVVDSVKGAVSNLTPLQMAMVALAAFLILK